MNLVLQILQLRRAGLRMGTALNLHHCQVSAEYGTGIDIHLVGVFDWFARRCMPEDKQVCTGDFVMVPIL